ncbi:dihydrolipoyl dehydrogenase [Vaccinium witches'-broom phytoplasma]|uniref:dihydrolipoyl dehydrogenase n=1 Tax=Vaccinium witches'-broom phytoplasma TaxID=85642 RepID=UPI000368C6BF|nr:dihydrolipoyl dehydrogenase [Vaccinium witches'-broom phytoplasma]
MERYDILIIGGGPGGYTSAIKASQMGAKVALVEDHKLGGICLNYGCIPTKAFLKSAKIFDLLKHSKEYGIETNADVEANWTSVLERKNKIVKQLTNGISFLMKKNKIDVYKGFADALSAHQVQVGDKILETKKLIIATGASAFIPPIKGAKEAFKNKYLYTSKELVQLEKFPQKLVIIGGGVIGVEFATIFNKFGAEVIILERANSILNVMDKDIVDAYTKKLKSNQIKILTESEVMKIDNNKVHYTYENETHVEEADIVLMATGTKPNLKGIEKLNLQTDRIGVMTDGFLKTSLEDVYAIGDVNGKYMLAHVSSHEGIIAVTHALEADAHLKPMNYDRVPSCVYGFPEIATIGWTEEQVKLKDIEYKVSKVPVKAIGKALADGETDGFAKLIVDKKDLKVLGMHIFSYNATELISEIGVTMELEGTAHDVVRTIHPHPTLSELTLETFLGAIDKPIHM